MARVNVNPESESYVWQKWNLRPTKKYYNILFLSFSALKYTHLKISILKFWNSDSDIS
jgi:hypothetical protein